MRIQIVAFAQKPLWDPSGMSTPVYYQLIMTARRADVEVLGSALYEEATRELMAFALQTTFATIRFEVKKGE